MNKSQPETCSLKRGLCENRNIKERRGVGELGRGSDGMGGWVRGREKWGGWMVGLEGERIGARVVGIEGGRVRG